MKKSLYKNWSLIWDDDDILWLNLDCNSSPVNKLTKEVMEEFSLILDEVEKSAKTSGLIIFSGKPNNFIVGADITAFDLLKNEEEAYDAVREGQQLFARLELLDIPTLALISGYCLGGGLEFALACDYRIANEDSSTRLGLPEVLLGIHPGWGGTIRLTRLIGPINALGLILKGKMVVPKVAKKMGFIDDAVPERHLQRAAVQTILRKPKLHQPTLLQGLMNTLPFRLIISKIMENETAKKASINHYPAPFAVIRNWKKEGVVKPRAMKVEARSISKLMFTETSRNLRRVFNLRERLKSFGKNDDFKVSHVHVVGAGIMGGDIAAWCVCMGMTVTLQDQEPKFIAPAIKRAQKTFKRKLKDQRLISAAMDRLIPDTHGYGVARADVIIEAVFEDLNVKRKLFKTLENKAKPGAILATNTSSIPLEKIAKVLDNPDRLIGIHFFNPVAMMPLVEVVYGKKTDQSVVNDAMAFVSQIDRLALPVKSSPGFLVNRVLMPYLMEAMSLYEEGMPPLIIDKQAEEFGMPMGPIELADTVGLDVCLFVAKNLCEYYGGEVPKKLIAMVEKGHLGKKSGEGFYQYKRGKVVKPAVSTEYKISGDITDRLIMRLINEAAACLREGIVEDADCLDAGIIFGTGFAPFRGGPMHYAESVGLEKYTAQLQKLVKQYGDRFKLDPACFPEPAV